MSDDQDNNRTAARAVRARQRAIGRELRRFYDGVVSEPVPDEFVDLLRQIDEADQSRGDTGGKPS